MTSLSATKIAEALGVSGRAVRKRAKKQNWQPTGERTRGGGNVYDLDTLPLTNDEKRRIRGRLQCEEMERILLAPLTADGHEAVPPASPEQPALPSMDNGAGEKARYKADLLALYQRAVAAAGWGNKVAARLEFEQAYNSGLAWPHLYEQLGPVSWKTIESWSVKVRKRGLDRTTLIDRRGAHLRGKSALTQEQTDIFLSCLLRPNKPRISEAYRIAKAVMRQKGIEEVPSESTFRRGLARWKSTNNGVWVWAREGAKAWNDKCAHYIERDFSRIGVGDVIVADGHSLNFEILNPWTGKPQNHMALILFFDMRSNMPLGWEIMPTENTAAISSALRRTVLRLGKYPRVVYLDNGRAFKARFFSGAPNFDEAGFAGLYQRMGCETIHAWPYHGQSKTVERFFGTFAELERLIPTYTGTSIENKPPRMMRGEKRHRALHERQFGGRVLTMAEAHLLVASWFEAYAKRPQRGHLDGATPAEVFEAGRGPGVDRAELTWLMMSLEVKTIHRNGVTFQGQNYYHPALAGRKHAVRIHYDLQDTSSIWVTDKDGALLCEATPVTKLHPAAAQLGTDEDKEQLRAHIAAKREQEKGDARTATELLRLEVLPAHQRQLEAMGLPALPATTGQPSSRPGNVVSFDYEKAVRDADEQQAIQAEAEARELREAMKRLDEPDRYERLVELEAQGKELIPEWSHFMVYFEKTDAYTGQLEYWEQCRLKYGLLYRAAVSNEA